MGRRKIIAQPPQKVKRKMREKFNKKRYPEKAVFV
jgi:hypothetical protein